MENITDNPAVIEAAARLACAAYWRGRLERLIDGQELELLLKQMVNALWPEWEAAARLHLSGIK